MSAFERVAARRGVDVPKPRTSLRLVTEEPATVESGTHRPPLLREIVGQGRLTMRLDTHIKSAVANSRPPGHVLLDGASGLGKTTVACTLSAELNKRKVPSEFHKVMAPEVKDVRALVLELEQLSDNDVLLLDEIHLLPKPVQYALYSGLEDGEMTVKADRRSPAQTFPLPKITIVGATTHPGKLMPAFRGRFKFVGHIEPYQQDDLALLLLGHCERAEITLDFDAAEIIARASRCTPRQGIELLAAVRDYAYEMTGDINAPIDAETARQGLEYAEVDALGLDQRDLRVAGELLGRFRGGSIGLKPLSTALGMDITELTDDVLPYLIQAGLWEQQPRGQAATKALWLHMTGKIPPLINGMI